MIYKALSRAVIKISFISGLGVFSTSPEGKEKLLQLLQFTLRKGVVTWNTLATKWNKDPTSRTEMLKGSEELLQRLSGKINSRTEAALLIDTASEIEKMPTIKQPDSSTIHIIMPYSEGDTFELKDLDKIREI